MLTYVLLCCFSTLLNAPIRRVLLWNVTTEEQDQFKKQFGLDRSARVIGILERFIYIFAVMIGEPTIISGWIAMKAFAKWLEKSDDVSSSIEVYNHYIVGNGLSLFVALLLGKSAVIVEPWIHSYF